MTTKEKIERVGAMVTSLLVEKNQAYGDSATKPINVFSKGNAVDSLCARIDDKISRIKQRGINDKTEDTVMDLCGYLILLLIALEDDKKDEVRCYYGKDPVTGKEYIVNGPSNDEEEDKPEKWFTNNSWGI